MPLLRWSLDSTIINKSISDAENVANEASDTLLVTCHLFVALQRCDGREQSLIIMGRKSPSVAAPGIIQLSLFFIIVSCTKIKIIDEPFSLHHAGIQPQNVAPAEREIIAKVKPQALSGPPHLFPLAGKCFTLEKLSYKYEFCPFNNVTQREQTYRWNAFHGVLGVWQEWNIVDDEFQSMSMTDGELCIGQLSRQVAVMLKCGDEDKIIDIQEPRTCKYNLTFETPLACALDGFLVYPALSDAGREQWQDIERSYREEELTLQGYEKKRRKLFIKEGFMVDENAPKKETKQDEMKSLEKNSLPGAVEEFQLFSRNECLEKYGVLLEEVKRLRERVKSTEKGNLNTTTIQKDNHFESNAGKVELTTHSGKNLVDESHAETAPANRKEVAANFTGELEERRSSDSDEMLNMRHPGELVHPKDMKKKGRRGDDGYIDNELNLRHPKNLKKKGKKGEDGFIAGGKRNETAVSAKGNWFGRMFETSRKKVVLSKEEQEQRDKELREKQIKNHRIH